MSKDDDEKDPDILDEGGGEGEAELEVNTSNLVALTGSAIVSPEVVVDDDVARIFDRIAEISHQVVHDGYLELGRLFFRVRKDALYVRRVNPTTGKPYETWDQYVDVESDFSTRSINYMIAIWWWFSALKSFPQIRNLIREVGWKKTRALVGVADDQNYEAWFEKAKNLPFTDLYKLTSVAMDKAGIQKRPAPAHAGAFRPDPKGILPEEAPPREERQRPAVEAIEGGVDVRPLTGDAADVSVETKAEVVPSGSGEVPVVPAGGGLPTPTVSDVKAYEEQKREWKARMTQAQIDHVERALDAVWDVLLDAERMSDRPAKDEVGRGLALEMLATHLLAFYGGTASQVKELRGRAFLAELVKAVEKNYGIDLVVLDRRRGEVLHGLGEDLLEGIEKKLQVELVAFRKGTNTCVYGWEKAQSLDEVRDGSEDPKPGKDEEESR